MISIDITGSYYLQKCIYYWESSVKWFFDHLLHIYFFFNNFYIFRLLTNSLNGGMVWEPWSLRVKLNDRKILKIYSRYKKLDEWLTICVDVRCIITYFYLTLISIYFRSGLMNMRQEVWCWIRKYCLACLRALLTM